MRAYIVESSKAVLVRLVSLLEEVEGLEVVGQAGSLKAAAEGILRLRPDVVLIDLRLPDGDGLELLAATRACGLEATSIVMALDCYPAYRKKARTHGADYFLDKTRDLWKVPSLLVQMIAARRAG